MADEFTFSVDSDWKKQAQEEKRTLAEEAQRQQSASTGASTAPASGASGSKMKAGPAPTGAPAGRSVADRGQRGRGETPEASFEALVQTMASQVLMYLGGVAMSNGEGIVDLDTARHQLDLLGVLEEKTQGNLASDEQSTLDVALYESRMRFTSVAARYIL